MQIDFDCWQDCETAQFEVTPGQAALWDMQNKVTLFVSCFTLCSYPYTVMAFLKEIWLDHAILWFRTYFIFFNHPF